MNDTISSSRKTGGETMVYDGLLVAGRVKQDGECYVVFHEDYLLYAAAELEKAELKVLLYIASKTKAKKANAVEIKRRKAASILDLSPSSVTKALEGLEYKGFIEDGKSGFSLCVPEGFSFSSSDESDFDDIWGIDS
jgi:CRP-like cAMP-binding protein